MPDSACPAPPAVSGHRRRRPPVDVFTLHRARRAVALPLVLLATLLTVAFTLRSLFAVGPGWIVVGLLCPDDRPSTQLLAALPAGLKRVAQCPRLSPGRMTRPWPCTPRHPA